MSLNASSDGGGEILSIVVFFNCSRNEINVSGIDVFSAASGSLVDCRNHDIKDTCTNFFSYFAFG